MTDFTKSFNAGMQAATQAESNRAEVDDVFKELNEQIGSLTDGKVQFSIRTFDEKINPLTNIFTDRKQYTAIAAHNPKAATEWVELALWEQDVYGYPCKVHLGRETKYCEDKEAVSNAIRALISEVGVAKKIRNLMARPAIEDETF